MVLVGVLGTGKTARSVVEKCLHKQHRVAVLAPAESDYEPHHGLQVVIGSARHGPDILKVVKGCDVVVVAMSDEKGATANSAELVTSAVISVLFSKPKRVMVVTSNGCNGGFLNKMMQKVVGHKYVPSFSDLQQADRLVMESIDTAWLLVRPNRLVEESTANPRAWKYAATAKGGFAAAGINSGDVAQFLADHVEDTTWDRCPVHLFKGDKNKFDGTKMAQGLA